MSDSVVIRHAWYEGDHPARRRTLTGRLCARLWRSIVARFGHVSLGDDHRDRGQGAGGGPEAAYLDPRLLLPWPLNNLLLKKIKATEILVSTKVGEFFVLIDHAEPVWVRARLSSWIEKRRLRRPDLAWTPQTSALPRRLS